MSTSDAETNKQTFTRFQDATNSGDLQTIVDSVNAVMTPDARFHTPDGPVPALAAQPKIWAALLQAFPDIRVTIEDLVAEGDRVASRQIVTGTHLGEFQGIAPTGRTVRYDEIFIARFADGLITELWGVVDTMSMLRQLGVTPPVPAKAP